MAEGGDVVGEPSLRGRPMSLGALFPLLDMTAGRCAGVYSKGYVVTGCFDDVTVEQWVRHGDIVIVRANVVAVGSSSMTVSMILYREVLRKRKRRQQVAIRCFATFVAVEGVGLSNPRKNLPKIGDNIPLEMRHTVIDTKKLMPTFKKWRFMLSTTDSLILSEAAEREPSTKTMYEQAFSQEIEIAETALQVRKQFLPRHKNFSGFVFGGDILTALENVASSCAARLSNGWAQFRTVAIRSLSFLAPVPPTKLLQISAKVIATSEHFACVIVRGHIDEAHDGSNMVLSHQGIFLLMAIGEDDETHTKIEVGIEKVFDESNSHLNDFHRAMAFPLPEWLKKNWDLEGDRYPSSRYV